MPRLASLPPQLLSCSLSILIQLKCVIARTSRVCEHRGHHCQGDACLRPLLKEVGTSLTAGWALQAGAAARLVLLMELYERYGSRSLV